MATKSYMGNVRIPLLHHNRHGLRHRQSQLIDAECSRLLTLLAEGSDTAEREKFAWGYVRQAILDPLVWGYAFLFHGFAFVLYTLSLFLVLFIALPCTIC